MLPFLHQLHIACARPASFKACSTAALVPFYIKLNRASKGALKDDLTINARPDTHTLICCRTAACTHWLHPQGSDLLRQPQLDSTGK
jgi:hypothetical protein